MQSIVSQLGVMISLGHALQWYALDMCMCALFLFMYRLCICVKDGSGNGIWHWVWFELFSIVEHVLPETFYYNHRHCKLLRTNIVTMLQLDVPRACTWQSLVTLTHPEFVTTRLRHNEWLPKMDTIMADLVSHCPDPLLASNFIMTSFGQWEGPLLADEMTS